MTEQPINTATPRRTRFRARVWVLGLASLGAVALGGPSTVAAAPEEVPLSAVFLDTENSYAVIVNNSREAICTPEQVQYENDSITWRSTFLAAFIAWIQAGNNPADFVPQPPQPPPFPAGIEDLTVVQKTTGGSAIVQHIHGREVPVEVWAVDDDAPGIGPCLDTASETLVGTGTADVVANDNDVAVSGTRTNAFGSRVRADLVDPNGSTFTYTRAFHLNDACNVPDTEPPACLIERYVVR